MHPNFATDILIAYFMCAGCVTVQVVAQHHKRWRLVLPVAGPTIFFFFGREMHAGLPWQTLLGPVCASIGIASICSVLANITRQEQVVPTATTASLSADMVQMIPVQVYPVQAYSMQQYSAPAADEAASAESSAAENRPRRRCMCKYDLKKWEHFLFAKAARRDAANAR